MDRLQRFLRRRPYWLLRSASNLGSRQLPRPLPAHRKRPANYRRPIASGHGSLDWTKVRTIHCPLEIRLAARIQSVVVAAYLLDGNVFGTTSESVPTDPMHWMLQTQAGTTAPAATTAGHLLIDWVAVYTYQP